MTTGMSTAHQAIRPRRSAMVARGHGGLLAVVGLAGVVGSLGPWARLHEGPDISGTLYGLSGSIDIDGDLTSVLMGLVLVAGLVIAVRARTGLWPIPALLASGIAVLTASMDESGLTRGDDGVPAQYVDRLWGGWLVLGSAWAALALAVVGMVVGVLGAAHRAIEPQGEPCPS